jgi:hypothetical protein
MSQRQRTGIERLVDLNFVVQSAGRVCLPVLIIILLDCKEAKMPDPMDDEHQPSATL